MVRSSSEEPLVAGSQKVGFHLEPWPREGPYSRGDGWFSVSYSLGNPTTRGSFPFPNGSLQRLIPAPQGSASGARDRSPGQAVSRPAAPSG